MSDAHSQLPLPFAGPASPDDAAVLRAPSNAGAMRWLEHDGWWPHARLALHGPAGSGKTHLARAWAGANALLLDGARLGIPSAPPQAARIVIDRADTVTDEHALLHWLNLCAALPRRLLLTARQPPARWPAALPDLASRLRATTAVGIAQPEDDLLRALLAMLLAARQLAVPASVQIWLLSRLPRTAGAIADAVSRLDRASLARAQPVTRALVRQTLVDLLAPGEDDSI